ncbi:MAG: hypothetical protein OXD34_05215 [bacterium]|nr:hypothetical protein [bacterium]
MTEHADPSVYVTWRHPEGPIHPVGLLTRLVSNGSESYRFVYLKGSESLEGFLHLPGLPDLHQVYESEDLFPVFRSRQMSTRRPDYKQYVKKLKLDVNCHPFEVMARGGGRRSTDRIEVFAPPTRTTDGNLTTLFFVRGIRHREGASEALAGLQTGGLLELKDEPDNEYNPQAVLVRTPEGKDVGWVPDYLVEMVHDLRGLTGEEAVSVTAEHINPPDVAPSMRLICRLKVPWPDHYEPLTGPEFQPIVA